MIMREVYLIQVGDNEHENGSTDAKFLLIFKIYRRDPLLIDESAIGAVKITQDHPIPHDIDTGMLPRGFKVFYIDIGIAAANQHFHFIDWKNFTGVKTLDYGE